MFIYKITNKVNGKIYIGKTIKSIEERFKKHLKCAENKVNRHLYDAMNHYGYENFELTLIETCKTVESLNQRESFWISYYDSMSPSGYNMTRGGDGEILLYIGVMRKNESCGNHKQRKELVLKKVILQKRICLMLPKLEKVKKQKVKKLKHPLKFL